MAENDVMEEYAHTWMTLNVNNVNLNVIYLPELLRVQRQKKNPVFVDELVDAAVAHVIITISLRHAARREIKSRTIALTLLELGVCLHSCPYRQI